MQRFTSGVDPTSGKLEVTGLPKEGQVYATLGANSLVDRVRIGGIELGPRTIVPIVGGERLELVRPNRQDGAGTVNTLVELLLWDCGESPAVTPRDAFSTDPFTSAAAFAAFTRALRVPFAGRRAAAFYLQSAAGVAVNWAIIGVRYDSAADYRVPMNTGTYTPALSAVDGVLESYCWLEGGFNDHEGYDELELWIQKGAGAFQCRGEAYDLGAA